MSIFGDRTQANPTDPDTFEEGQQRAKVAHVVKSLDASRPGLVRWFFLALIAFNLVVWSLALPIAFLVR